MDSVVRNCVKGCRLQCLRLAHLIFNNRILVLDVVNVFSENLQ